MACQAESKVIFLTVPLTYLLQIEEGINTIASMLPILSKKGKNVFKDCLIKLFYEQTINN